MKPFAAWWQQCYRTLRFGRRYVSVRFARHYDEWKAHEDWAGNLVRTLSGIFSLHDACVADLGTGTGQIAFKLAPFVRRVYGYDNAEGMIRYASEKARRLGLNTVEFKVASFDSIPLPDDSVDLAIFGWSLTSLLRVEWEHDWLKALRQVLHEAERLVGSAGTIAVVETVNVRNELPWGVVFHPIRRTMVEVLENDLGFQKVLFSNDWDYRSQKALRKAARFWLDAETFRSMRAARTTIFPECAGIWWRQTSPRTSEVSVSKRT